MTKDMQSFISICKRHEFEIELIHTWHARAYYSGKEIFDFYPKNKRLFDLMGKSLKSSWYTLDYIDWKKQLYRLLETFLFTNCIYVDAKDVSVEVKIMRIIKSNKP